MRKLFQQLRQIRAVFILRQQPLVHLRDQAMLHHEPLQVRSLGQSQLIVVGERTRQVVERSMPVPLRQQRLRLVNEPCFGLRNEWSHCSLSRNASTRRRTSSACNPTSSTRTSSNRIRWRSVHPPNSALMLHLASKRQRIPSFHPRLFFALLGMTFRMQCRSVNCGTMIPAARVNRSPG